MSEKLQGAGGISAIGMALIYVLVFVFYGTMLGTPASQSVSDRLAFLGANQLELSIITLLGYVVFGALLAVTVPALHQRLNETSPALSQVASVFGLVWVGLVFASGMISNIGLAAVIKLGQTEPENAIALWRTITHVVEGLGGGNEVTGGLWVLLLSMAAIGSNKLPRLLCYLGLLVGMVGIATVYPAQVLTEVFGVTQIVWFAWLGWAMLKTKVPAPMPATGNLP